MKNKYTVKVTTITDKAVDGFEQVLEKQSKWQIKSLHEYLMKAPLDFLMVITNHKDVVVFDTDEGTELPDSL